MTRTTLLPVTTLTLIGSVFSVTALAQEPTLTEEERQRMEQLSSQISQMTDELDQLKARAEVVEDAPKLWNGDIEFGYVKASGNTEETNVKSRADVNREQGNWHYNIFFDSLNTKAEEERTAEKYFFSNRLAYDFSEYNYWFARASYDDDRFSGFDYQATASVGYGRRLLHSDAMEWDVEVGPGYRYSKFEEGSAEDDSEDLILRVGTEYAWQISDTTAFTQSINVEAGDDNTISKSITALKTQIIGAFSLKLSYTIKYTEEVPAATEHADQETAVTLAYSF